MITEIIDLLRENRDRERNFFFKSPKIYSTPKYPTKRKLLMEVKKCVSITWYAYKMISPFIYVIGCHIGIKTLYTNWFARNHFFANALCCQLYITYFNWRHMRIHHIANCLCAITEKECHHHHIHVTDPHTYCMRGSCLVLFFSSTSPKQCTQSKKEIQTVHAYANGSSWNPKINRNFISLTVKRKETTTWRS